jgi:hypothetical protein
VLNDRSGIIPVSWATINKHAKTRQQGLLHPMSLIIQGLNDSVQKGGLEPRQNHDRQIGSV